MPVQTFLKVPFFPLAQLSSHKEKLFTRMTPHITKKSSQIRKTLPEITRHFINEGSLHMYDFIVRKWQNKVLRVGVHEREGNVIMLVSSMNGIHVHVIQHIVHPPHIPF